MIALPTASLPSDCWKQIGVWGDRSCPELTAVVHCHNCPVFAAAGRRFLDGPTPAGYQAEWEKRLAEPEEDEPRDLLGVLIFRIGEEWLAMPVQSLVEVIPMRLMHRIPFRSILLAGLVNVRGELQLAVRTDRLLGIREDAGPDAGGNGPVQGVPAREVQSRLLVARRGADALAFLVDEVDRVHRFPLSALTGVPPTLARASARFTRGVFRCDDRAIGLLDDGRLFEVVRAKLR